MNKKRFVSLFLALSMLTSYIPSNVYAAETTQEIQELKTSGTDYVASSSALDVDYKVIDQWDTGFNGEVTLTNTSDTKVEGWEIRFMLPHEITNIWNAQITNKEENIYTVKNAGHNADVAPNESVSFGFTASFEGEIKLPTLKYTLYDHFGLNELDIDYSKTLIDKFGVQIYAKDLTLFRSWYLLQHNENYNGEYKPFVTVIEFERPFSGSIS